MSNDLWEDETEDKKPNKKFKITINTLTGTYKAEGDSVEELTEDTNRIFEKWNIPYTASIVKSKNQ